jgi:hypothetical protein
MGSFDVAHLHEQGQDMIIIPLDRQFQFKSDEEQDEIHDSLQVCASAAGLRGTVVLVWDGGGGRMAFRAPQPWHPFFRSINLAVVAQNINRTLTCG